VPLIVCWLILGAIFFTCYLGFINVRGFKHAVDIVRGHYPDPSHKGEISHFQALATAVSGTVGIGNIAGVAITVSIGGPGAIFWVIVAGLVGMTTKFVECTLGVKYRQINADGTTSGGPMYYLRDGLAKRGMTGFGKFLGLFYAISIVIGCLGIGNMFQSNQAYMQLLAVSGGETSMLQGKGWIAGLVMAALVGAIIIGGIKSDRPDHLQIGAVHGVFLHRRRADRHRSQRRRFTSSSDNHHYRGFHYGRRYRRCYRGHDYGLPTGGFLQ